MPPTREGIEIAKRNPCRDKSQTLIFNTFVEFSAKDRPMVVRQKGGSVETYADGLATPTGATTCLAGILQPMVPLVVTSGQVQFPSGGNITDEVKLAIRRYHSTRGVASNPCPIYPSGTTFQSLSAQSITIGVTTFNSLKGDEGTDTYDRFQVLLFSKSYGVAWKVIGDVPKNMAVQTVTNKALTSNVATLTLGSTAGLEAGMKITVALSPPDAVFDGTQTITSVTSTTITFAKTNTNIASTAAGGTVTPFFQFNPSDLSVTLADSENVPLGLTAVSSFNFPLPPICAIQAVSNGETRRIMGVGANGFDPFKDMPRVAYFTPSARMSSSGVVTASGSPNLSSYKDGTYIVTVYDGTESVILTGYIGTAPSGQNSTLTIYTDIARTSVATSDGSVTGDYATQRWEIRRQVVGKATQGSDRIQLFYDTAATSSAAEVAEGYWLYTGCFVGGAEGPDVLKPSTASGTYSGSLNSNKTRGTEIVLFAEWTGESTTGLLQLKPYNRRVWFSEGAANTWECTASSFWIDIQSLSDFYTLGPVKSLMAIIGSSKNIYPIAIGSIPDPTDLEGATEFFVSDYVEVGNPINYGGTCCSRSTLSIPNGDLYFPMYEGLAQFTGAEVLNAMSNLDRERWENFYAPRLNEVFLVYDSAHRFAPVIRVMGIATNATSDNSTQIVYIPDKRACVLFGLGNSTAGSCVSLTNGTNRIMFGGSSRLWMYGSSSRSGQDTVNDLYGNPTVVGVKVADVDADLSTSPIAAGGTGTLTILGTDLFTLIGQGCYYKNAGISVFKIRPSTNVWQAAIITDISSDYTGQSVEIYAVDAWDVQEGDWIILGPRVVTVRLPTIYPPSGLGLVALRTLQFEIEDDSNIGADYPWPLKFQVFTTESSSLGYITPTPQTSTMTLNLNRNSTGVGNQTFPLRLIGYRSAKFSGRYEIIAPTDGNLFLKAMTVGVTLL